MEDNTQAEAQDTHRINKKSIQADLEHYAKTMKYMGADIPIQCLCLPKDLESFLLKRNFFRVYDLLDDRFKSVKGLGKKRAIILASKLYDVFSIET
jgi:hypothetical protein